MLFCGLCAASDFRQCWRPEFEPYLAVKEETEEPLEELEANKEVEEEILEEMKKLGM